MSKLNLVLTYFDSLKGPRIFLTLPNDLPDKESEERIREFMNLEVETFFEVNLVEENLKTINLNFDIPSKIARGQKEMAMVSLVIEKNIAGRVFHDSLKKIIEDLSSIDNIYKGFYISNSQYSEDPEVEEKNKALKQVFSEGLKILEELIESSTIGNLLILGLNKAGKSSLVSRLKNKEFSNNIKPTLALTLIELMIESYLFKVIDVSGQQSLRYQWWSYTKKPEAIIYVLDVNDEGKRLESSQKEFQSTIKKFEEYEIDKKTPILICGNKIDLVPDRSEEDLKNHIRSILNLSEIEADMNINIFLTSASEGIGIQKAFSWLVTRMLSIT